MVFDLETNGNKGTGEGLDPRIARINAISIKTVEFEKLITFASEKRILEEFWNLVRSEDYILVGFNTKFDLRFLYLRSMINGVQVIKLDERTIDLRMIIAAGNEFAKGTLDQLSDLVGYQPNYSGFGKKAVFLLWRGHRIPELVDKLMDDSRRTYLLLEKMKEINLL